jgi:prepilin-type processing-associated H-X9-DG protein
MTDPAPDTERPQPSTAALASFLLGIASVPLLLLAGLPALFVGYRALYAINASEGRLTGRRLAVAGMVLGALMTLVSIAGFVVIIFVHLGQKSRLVECANNLRRIGEAVNLYHDATPLKTYPLAAVPNDALKRDDRLSWCADLLPYLDRGQTAGKKWQHVSDLIDRDLGWTDPANAEAADSVVAVFLCPSNPNYEPPVRPAPTHYPGIGGDGADAALLPKGDPRAGFFGFDRVLSRTDRDFPSGISRTLMVLESADRNGPWIAAGFPTVRGIPDVVPLLGRGAPFGGCHAGGANALYVDGSARFVSDTVEPAVLHSESRLVRE